jgi:alkylation response protein AidB-like acyl-CoA dehydrogenase
MAERGSGNIATQELSAVLQSVLIAGALEKLLVICTDYANMREQFGKPIGKQQAIQHQLALLAEQCALVRVAAQFGCANGFDISSERAATAKCAASSAVPIATSIAHAVHGAIGITAEYDLHLWTERLYEWRSAAGSESYWASKMGAARLAQARQNSVEFITDI